MAYAIMRCAKLSSFGSVGGSLKHCFRERETLNADKSKTEHNTHFYAKSSDDAFRRLRERLDTQVKVRKNAVLCVEYVFTASPEFFEGADKEKRTQFFEQSLDWLKEKYGEQNIVVASVHDDEKTPHLSAFVVPIDAKGKLNAKGLIGNREQMSKDQDSYHAKVADLGLERGIKGSKAKHQTIQQYYANLRQNVALQAVSPDEVNPKKLGWFHVESDAGVAQRINKRIKPIIAKAQEYEVVKNRTEVLQQVLKEKDNEINELTDNLTRYKQAFTKDLTKDQIDALIHAANQARQKNKQAKEFEEAKRREEREKTRGYSR